MGVDQGFAGTLPGRFVRTMSITIGGVPKAELYEKAKAVRVVSPYAKRIMKHDQFTTLPKAETVLLIALTPEDLGFTERPTIAEVLWRYVIVTAVRERLTT